MRKSEYCSAEHGDPYPPCIKPNWHCEDCINMHKDKPLKA